MDKYKLFCITDNEWKYLESCSVPTVCPGTSGHEIDLDSIIYLGSEPLTEDEIQSFSYIDIDCLKRSRRDNVNELTHELIVEGMLFPVSGANGGYARVPMNDEDQHNYIGMTISKDFLSYSGPDAVHVKCIDLVTGEDVFYYPPDANAVITFWGAGMQHVKVKLEEGWAIKADIMAMTVQELKNWVDPRL